jgi:hypothetical protein
MCVPMNVAVYYPVKHTLLKHLGVNLLYQKIVFYTRLIILSLCARRCRRGGIIHEHVSNILIVSHPRVYKKIMYNHTTHKNFAHVARLETERFFDQGEPHFYRPYGLFYQHPSAAYDPVVALPSALFLRRDTGVVSIDGDHVRARGVRVVTNENLGAGGKSKR